MTDAILGPLEHLMTSWWAYAALFGLCVLDAFVPVFPSEAPVILAGVYAASEVHGPNLLLMLVVVAIGASIGDHISYFLGQHVLGGRLLLGGKRRTELVERVRGIIHDRGSWALLVVRFIPGGRTVATIIMGATRFPLRQFTLFDLLATSVWATHGLLMGYLGGRAFGNNTLAAIGTGIVLALGISAIVELIRARRTR